LLFIYCPNISAQDLKKEVESILSKILVDHDMAAISAAASVEGKIVLSLGVGYIDMEHKVQATGSSVYRIASISKPMTATAVMKLVQDGSVKINATIQTYVPSYPVKRWPVTIFHLLTHSSGIRHFKRFGEGASNTVQHHRTVEKAMAHFKEDELLFEPGSDVKYTTLGFVLLQGVIENVTGIGFEEFMKKNVWGPAHMNDTMLDIHSRIVENRVRGYVRDRRKKILMNAPYYDLSNKYAGGGMISSAEDVVRFCIALENLTLLDKDTYTEMLKTHIRYGEENKIERGLGWVIDSYFKRRKVAYHTGGVPGFHGFFAHFPDEKVNIVVLSNSNDAPMSEPTWEISELLFDRFKKKIN
jgi:CubicO group peptidase (beta-lactamase class C family)